jgi:Bromodomain
MDALQLTKRLRKDLSDVRTLAELSRKRESRKLGQAQIVQEVLSQVVFSHEAWLRMTFENIVASVHFLLILDNSPQLCLRFDRQGFFKNPISKSQVPDYFDVIQQPMWWSAIDEKLDRHEYWDVNAFKVRLLWLVASVISLPSLIDTGRHCPCHRKRDAVQQARDAVLQGCAAHTVKLGDGVSGA